ncbi:acyl carrier protein [Desulfosporosinus fructosivorans]|uniref:Acyl carrier protein n=1 Tax=Desulfosporosinus fructosivorans TaxID=2018669 RepID=A0A4Z0QYZ2_9FIRM|nr:phosphopantetheine-binding protein [Desulfosporosinus fructosivorans]TGE35738.1 acyl carrier protein [Desulfosporosinus fructosivorans]
MDRNVILEKLELMLKKHVGGNIENTSYDTELSFLGLDSLGISEVVVEIEEEFDCVIRMDDFIKLKTLNDFADYIANELKP